eukprot:g3439.t1
MLDALKSTIVRCSALSPAVDTTKLDLFFGGITLAGITSCEPSLSEDGSRRFLRILKARAGKLPTDEEPFGFGAIRTRSLHDITIEYCAPLFDALVSCGGIRRGTDASSLATALAQWGATSMIRSLVASGYVVSGKADEEDPIVPPNHRLCKHPMAWASASHAAAYVGHIDVLDYLSSVSDVSTRTKAADLFGISADDIRYDGPLPHRCDESAPSVVSDDGKWPVRTYALPSTLKVFGSSACGVDVVRGSDVVADLVRFFETYILRRRPVLVRNLMHADASINVYAQMLARDHLTQHFGDTVWKPFCGGGAIVCAATKTGVKLETFVRDYALDTPASLESAISFAMNASRPAYIAQTTFSSPIDGRVRSVSEIFPFRPSFLDIPGNGERTNASRRHTWFVRPGETQFFIGGPATGSRFHFHGAAWNLVAYGQKTWLVNPPARSLFATAPASKVVNDPREIERLDGTYRCTQHAGDVFVLPEGWGHLTYNSALTVSVAGFF